MIATPTMSEDAKQEAEAPAPTNALAALMTEVEPAESAIEKNRRLQRECYSAIVDFLLEKGLYSTVDTSTEVGALVDTALRDATNCTFDTYCVACRDRSTFRIQTTTIARRPLGGKYAEHVVLPDLFAVQAVCQRAYHAYTYVFATKGNTLSKIGQLPSLADLSFAELRGIDKSLESVDRKELGTALGLFAHGTALGAFVYLRRVFERMVQRAHDRQSGAGHVVTGFDDMRMDERIAALKDELPEKVVQHSAVFSVLSVGLHELTEERCAQYFPVMKAVLFQMLEQEEHKRKAAITAKETEGALQHILTDLGASAQK